MTDCIFCKIISGELPCFKIYEDDYVLAFLDIHPVSRGHTIVIPKSHATNIFDILPNDWMHVCETARILATTLETSLGSDGINLMMNNRQNAGQVVDHPHVHLIPRYKNDGLKHWPSARYEDGDAEQVLKTVITKK